MQWYLLTAYRQEKPILFKHFKPGVLRGVRVVGGASLKSSKSNSVGMCLERTNRKHVTSIFDAKFNKQIPQ